MKCPSRNSFAMRGRKSKLHIIKIVIRKQIKNKVRNNCTSKNTHEKYVNIRTVLTFFQRQFFSTQNWKNTFSLPEQNLKKCVLFFRQFQPKSKLFSLSPSSFELHFEKKRFCINSLKNWFITMIKEGLIYARLVFSCLQEAIL